MEPAGDARAATGAPDGEATLALAGSPYRIRLDRRCGAHVVPAEPVQLDPVARELPVAGGPRSLDRLIGRQRALGAARTALEYGRDVEIVGPAGIGKTALIRAVCTDWLPATTPDGILMLPRGRPLRDTILFVFDACFVRPAETVPADEVLRAALGELRLLLVLDDPQPDGATLARLREWLPHSLLICSGGYERLPGATTVGVAGLSEHHGLELLETAVGHRFTVDESHAARSAAGHLGGEPLALVRLAALVRHHSAPLGDVVSTHGLNGPGANLQEAVLALTTPQERSVLETLAGFGAAGVDGDVVSGVVKGTDPTKALRRLRYLGLAEGDDHVGWRASADVVSTPEERAHAHKRLLRWVLDHHAEAGVVSRAAAPILIAQSAGLADERPVDVFQIARASEGPLAEAGAWAAWEATLEMGLAAARADADADQVAYFQHQLGVLALVRGEDVESRAHLQAALHAREYLTLPAGVLATTEVIDLLPGGGALDDRDATAQPDPQADSPDQRTLATDDDTPAPATTDGQSRHGAPVEGSPGSVDRHADTRAADPEDVPSEPLSDAEEAKALVASDASASTDAAPVWASNRWVLALAGGAVLVFAVIAVAVLGSGEDGQDSESGETSQQTGSGASTEVAAADAAAVFDARVVLQPASPALQLEQPGSIPIWVWNDGPDAVPAAELTVRTDGAAASVSGDGCETSDRTTTCALGDMSANAGSPSFVLPLEVTAEEPGMLSVVATLTSGGASAGEDAFTYEVS